MNSTTKKFLSAILTTAIVFTQAGAAVSAADSDPWGTSTSATQTTNTKSASKDFGNSKYWSEKDKYGYAYPYSYYYYAADPTAKKAYIEVYEALHDRKPTITVSETTRKTLSAINISYSTIVRELIYECPELYYAKYNKNEYDGTTKTYTYHIDYLPENTIESYEKTFAKVLKNFDAYLEKNNVATTKQFLSCASTYVGKSITYDNKSKGRCSDRCDSLVDALVDGRALCEGYVQAFNYICRAYGISSTYKSLAGGKAGHAVSSVVCGNVWYNYDPTAYKRSDRQMAVDSAYEKYDYTVRPSDEQRNLIPVCNGKAVKPRTSIPKPKTTTSTSNSSTSTPTKPTSDTKEDEFIDYHYKDDNFSFIVKNHISYARKDGYTYYKITPPEGKLDITIKYLKQMKADGEITYTELAKTKTYVRIKL